MNDNDSTPMVSVVMVAYNQEKLIKRAILGVVRQKCDFPVELIIADDSSTDGTCDVVEKMRRQYPGIIRLFRNERNLGVQSNYMEAFRHCRGRYMAMCDADDYWCDHSKLARQVGFLEEHPDYAMSFHRVINHYAGTGTKSFSNPRQKTDCSIKDLAQSNFITNCSAVYRRELVDLTRLPEWMKHDCWPDYPLHMLYARHGKIRYFSRPMAVYRRGDTGNWTAVNEYRRQEKALAVRRHLLEEFKENHGVCNLLRYACSQAVIGLLATAPDSKTRSEAMRLAMEEYGYTYPLADCLSASWGARPPLKRRLLKLARQIVSLFIPLPRP